MDDCFLPLAVEGLPLVPNSAEFRFRCRSDVVSSKMILGSSYVEFSGSKVIAKVLCPRALGKSAPNASLNRGTLECEVNFANFIVSTAESDTKVAHISQALNDTLSSALLLELYSKQLILLNIIIIESSDCDLCAAINAGTLALANAGFEMRDLSTSYCMTVDGTPGGSMSSTVTVGSMGKLNAVTGMFVEGRLDPAQQSECLAFAIKQCGAIREIMVAELTRSAHLQ
jgi:ribonuclease PH